MAVPKTQTLRLWQDKVVTEVEVAGSGPPLVYLHGAWGLRPDRDFLARLAATNTIYAPKHPGTSAGNSEAVHALDDWLDLVIYYTELLDRLELQTPALVGHSFGGMVAAELAAALPARIARLALIDPVGLWRDDRPVKNWMILSDTARAPTLFADPAGEGAKRLFGLPEDAKDRVAAQVDLVWCQACTGKFVWPIADRGLKKRIHRIAAPTLVLWGKADAIIAADYAQDFAARIAHAQVEFVDGAGHCPQLEQGEKVAQLVAGFVNG